MRRACGVALTCIAASAVAADPDPVPTHVDDPAKLGRLTRVLPPGYPKDALAKGIAGSVDVEGVVSGWGHLADSDVRPVDAQSTVFVEPVKAVIAHWRFTPLFGNDCMPARTRVGVRVVFDVEGGKPRIVMEHAAEKRALALPAQMTPLDRVAPDFPSLMLRAGIESTTYAHVLIDPSGKVTRVETSSFATLKNGRIPQESRDYRAIDMAFGREVVAAAEQWKFPALPDGQVKTRASCLTFIFRLRD